MAIGTATADPPGRAIERVADHVLDALTVLGEVRVDGVVEGNATDAPHGHTVAVTIIRPGTSNNGYAYAPAVLAESTALWEGAPAFCDHAGPLDTGRAGGRSVRDLVGVYAHPRYEEGHGVVAELRLYPTAHWLAEVIAAHIAEGQRNPAAEGRLGISADILVEKAPARPSAEGPARWRVERILRVNSADVVVNPSAGGSFDRITEGMKMGDTVIAQESTEQQAAAGAGATDLAGELRTRLFEAKTATLPPRARAAVERRLAGREWTGPELDSAVAEVRELVAEGAAASAITGYGASRPGFHGAARVTLTGRERMRIALDRLLGVRLPDSTSDVPRFAGLREAYVALTGDRFFSGRYSLQDTVLEANEVTTSILADALTDTLAKRLVQDYRAQVLWWKPIVIETAISDMRAQTRVLLNDFAALSTVTEGSAYANAAWGDTKETFTPAKRGNLVQVSMETFLNDDLHSVSRIPGKLATAAAITINESLSGLFTANAGEGSTMTDTNNVMCAAHNNKGTTALAAAELGVALVAMAKQANSASKRLGLMGRYLLVPPDLMWTAKTVCESPGLPGSPNNDVNPIHGLVTPIVVPNWTDANNWYVMADPTQLESIEVGYLQGRKEPELLLQDQQSAGYVFTNDYISWKVRFIYGCGWLDYRGAYGEVVA